MAMMYGVMQGMVTDAMDPMSSGRVRVRVPAVSTGDSWALSCAAKLRAGDKVIVAFESGDATRPVVLGKVGG